MQDKTGINGTDTDPLGRERNRDKTRIHCSLIGSQSPSRTADSSMVPRHPHHYSRSVTIFSTVVLFIGTIRKGHEGGRRRPRPPPRSPTATTTPILSFRQKVESPGLSKRIFCAFDWSKRRSACLRLSSFWRNDHMHRHKGEDRAKPVTQHH